MIKHSLEEVMDQEIPTLEEFKALEREFTKYINKLKSEWCSRNRVESRDVFEVMRPNEQAKVYNHIAQWEKYITPIAEAWWKERGFGIIWPEDNSKPAEYYVLE